jgi:hypothetical protein
MTSIMGKPLKHYATDRITNQRYFMLALENDTNKNECSVIDMDAMPSELRAELTEIINSDECQRVTDPWKVLDTKFFMDYPKQTILAVLRAKRWIKVVDSDNVLVQLPEDKTMTPKEIAESIREYRQRQSKTRDVAEGVKEAASEVVKVEEIERKNSEDIADLKQQVSSLAESVQALVGALSKKK